MTFFCILSCTHQEKDYADTFYKIEYTKGEPIIDFNTIVCLNEANEKTIELSSISLRTSEDLKTLELLLKIKRDNKKINSDLNKLTKDNLIIIPKLVYQINVNEDSVNNKNSDSYILKKIETEIKNQIILFDSIEKNTQNIDFKLFAKRSKKILKDNKEALQTI